MEKLFRTCFGSRPVKINVLGGIMQADAPFQLLQFALLKKSTRNQRLKMEETFYG